MLRSTLFGLLLCVTLPAQLVVRSIQAQGTATVSAPPDQAVIDVTVSTTGLSAQAASTKNATQTTGLLTALGNLLGPGSSVKTTNYYVYPVYQYAGGQSSISGYSANSTVEVTLTNLMQAGAVIDTSVANGATSVGGYSFSIQNPDPLRQQALTLATQQAMAHANAMATAAGHTVGAVRSVQEGTVASVIPYGIANGAAGASASSSVPTPVQPSLIQVQESVTLVVDLN